MKPLEAVVRSIVARRAEIAPGRALLVAISGIDAAGKGYCGARIAQSLGEQGLKVALIGADGWLNLPAVRFRPENAAEHFYEHGFRFAEMFERLVLPLKRNRRIDLEMDYAEEAATSYRKHRYQFHEIDVILLEGIFLLQRGLRHHFDLTCWVECSFATALARAVKRCQEGLPPDETMRAFQTIYFPAQCIHFERDAPQSSADLILPNEIEVAGTTGESSAAPDFASQTGATHGKRVICRSDPEV